MRNFGYIGNKARWGNGQTFVRSESAVALFDGLLLGDGHYTKGGSTISALFRLNQSKSHKDWVEKISSDFKEFGIDSVIKDLHPKVRKTSKGITINESASSYIRTPLYRTFIVDYKRWYQNGKKVIPDDLSIRSPITLAHWYMGDGNFYITKTKSKQITARLHTNGFCEEEVEKLKRQFEEHFALHATISHWREQPILTLQNKNAASFLDIVRPFLVPSFSYKAPEDCWKPAQCIKCGIDLIGKPRSAKYCNGHLRATRTEAHRRWINANRDHIREYWRTRRKA